jgi:hypothetical protein
MEDLKRRNHLGGIDMDGRILKYILYTGDEEIYMKF